MKNIDFPARWISIRSLRDFTARFARVLAMAATGLVIAIPSYAQSGASLLEEIIVTARKRDESVQNVPITITAWSAEQMEAVGISHAGDIPFYTPNFTWNSEYGKTTPQIYLRGVGTNNFSPVNTGPVAVYQDNIYHGPNVVQAFAAYDLDRVEVLKGPQGTLYGRNSTAGLVNFISRKPEIGAEANGYLRAEVGEYETTNFQGAIGIPISATVAGRASFAFNRNTGLWDNSNPDSGQDNAGRFDDISGRFQLLIQPNDQLSILLNGHFTYADPDTEPFKNIGVACPPGVTPGLTSAGSNCPDFTGFTDTGDFHETFTTKDKEELDAVGGIIDITYSTGAFTLTSLTGFDFVEHIRFDDVDGAPTISLDDSFDDEFDYWSQEVRLSGEHERFNWHVGGYYYFEQNKGYVTANFQDVLIAFGAPPGGVLYDRAIETESYAVFGQADYKVTDQLRVSAGVRWTYEEKTVEKYDFYFFDDSNLRGHIKSVGAIPNPAPSNWLVDPVLDYDEPTWRISVDYAFTEDLLGYASYSRGIKGSEVNGGPGTPSDTNPISPETLDAWEVGIKSDWADGRLRLNAAGFYYEYQDQQVSTFIVDPSAAGGVRAVLDNAAKSEIYGAEADLTWRPTDSITLAGALGWTDAEFDEYISATVLGDLTGNRPGFVPEFEATLLARYDFTLGNGGMFSIQGDLVHRGDMFFQPTNDPVLAEDDFTIFNFLARYSSPNDVYSVGLRVKNATDKNYFTSGFDVSGLGFYAIKAGYPRVITGEFQFNF